METATPVQLSSILDLDLGQLSAWMVERGLPKYRSKQIFQWIFQRRATTFAEMTDLGKDLRQQLESAFRIYTASIAAHQQADDGTEKLLIDLADGGRIECVLLRDGPRRSICLSSQVGCAMGCVFCA
ncbi:MAG: 23S rRNA (adenine(2503)-C(2))-methyltransferase RlmN, partial [Pirellulaceae bacterium]